MKNTLSLFIIGCFLMRPAWLQSQDSFQPEAVVKPTILVLETDMLGISALEAQTLSEYIRSELDSIQVNTKVDNNTIQAALKELGVEETGCTSDICILSLAHKLNATHTILWSLDKQDQKYKLTFSYYEVTAVLTLKKKVKKRYNGAEDGLVQAIQQCVWNLLEQAPPEDRFPEKKVTGIKQLIKQQVDRVGMSYVIGAVVLISAGVGGAIYLAADVPEKPADIGLPPDWPEP